MPNATHSNGNPLTDNHGLPLDEGGNIDKARLTPEQKTRLDNKWGIPEGAAGYIEVKKPGMGQFVRIKDLPAYEAQQDSINAVTDAQMAEDQGPNAKPRVPAPDDDAG